MKFFDAVFMRHREPATCPIRGGFQFVAKRVNYRRPTKKKDSWERERLTLHVFTRVALPTFSFFRFSFTRLPCYHFLARLLPSCFRVSIEREKINKWSYEIVDFRNSLATLIDCLKGAIKRNICSTGWKYMQGGRVHGYRSLQALWHIFRVREV